MNIIEKIRAEVERQRKEIRPTDTGEMKVVGTPTQLEQGWLNALSWMEKTLDTLQEPIDKWSNKERKARVKKTGEIVCGFTDGQGHFDIPTDHNEFIRYNLDELEFDTLQEQPIDLDDAINNWQGIEAFPEGCGITPLPKAMEIVDKTARHFYELGRQSKGAEWTEEDIKNGSYISAFLQANCGDNVILKEATIWFMSRLKQLPIQQSKLEVCEGLEEELVKYIGYPEENLDGKWKKKEVEDIARHFAQWGAEHLKK